MIAELRQHPLTRALRVDKSTLAALQATLLHYACGEAEREVPVWRMIAMPLEELAARAANLVAQLGAAGIPATVVQATSTIGGGALPGETLPTWAVAVVAAHVATTATPSPDGLAAALRRGDPPVIGRILDEQLLLDPRTVPPGVDEALLQAVQAAWGRMTNDE